jgi:hypothetical protein
MPKQVLMQFKDFSFRPRRLVQLIGYENKLVWTTTDWCLQPGHPRQAKAIQDINASGIYRFFNLDIFEHYLCSAYKKCRFDKFIPSDWVNHEAPIYFRAGNFKGWVATKGSDNQMFVLISHHRSHWTEYGQKHLPIEWQYCDIVEPFPTSEIAVKQLLVKIKQAF